MQINDSFLDVQFLAMSHANFVPWYTDIVNYLAIGVLPSNLSSH